MNQNAEVEWLVKAVPYKFDEDLFEGLMDEDTYEKYLQDLLNDD